MKSDLSIEQKIKIYIDCEDFLNKCLKYKLYNVFICSLLHRELACLNSSVYKIGKSREELFNLFEEMIPFMPSDKMNGILWFPLDEEGLKSRIKLMGKIIKAAKVKKDKLKNLPTPTGLVQYVNTQKDTIKNEEDVFKLPLEERERIYKIVLADLKYMKEKNQKIEYCIPWLLFNEISNDVLTSYRKYWHGDKRKLELMFPEFYCFSFSPPVGGSCWRLTIGNEIYYKIDMVERVLGVIETKKLFKRKGVYNGY